MIAELERLRARVAELERVPPDLHSRSEMRRAAVQSPDALIAEIERLRAEVERAHSQLDYDKTASLEAENARLREALENCMRITLDLKYGNDAEWVRINVGGVVSAALEGK